LNGGQIEAKGEGKGGTEKGRNSDDRDTPHGKSYGQRQGESARRDALAEPDGHFVFHRRWIQKPAHVIPTDAEDTHFGSEPRLIDGEYL
jgi:hypothetical protein